MNIKLERTTMYIKNRRNSTKIKAFGSYQSLCLTESSSLRNHLLFIYKTVCANNITIGENVTVSWNVIIMDTDWHQTMNVNTGLKNIVSRPVRISSNNWIGFNCIILKGTETNDYCIVSSNSLLNRKYNNLPVNSIIAGSPAILVKENIRRC